MKLCGSFVKLLLLTILIVLLGAAVCFSEPLKNAIDITQVGMGARPIGLGGAYLALADDASAVFTNPAGLGFQNRISVVSMNTQLLTFVDYKLAAVAYPTEWGTFGIGYITVTAPGGDYIYMDGPVTVEAGSINYTNSLLVLSYGADVSDQITSMFYLEPEQRQKVGLGANIKFLSQGFTGIKGAPSATGIELDLGAMYMPFDNLTVGTTLVNVYRGRERESLTWTTGEKETLPTILKLGCSYRIIETVIVLLDADTFPGSARKSALHFGTEWQAISFLTFRVGLDQKEVSVSEEKTDIITNYTLGLGINYAGFRFDYAYKQDQQFSEFSTHYFSICYTGPVFEKPKKVEDENPLAQYEKLIGSGNGQMENIQ